MSTLDTDKRGDAVILTPQGGLTGGAVTEALENAFDDVLADVPGRLIVDMSDVEHINSIGMAAIIRAHATSRKNGTRFTLCNCRDRIHAVFEVTRLTTLGILCATLEEALSAGDGSPSSG